MPKVVDVAQKRELILDAAAKQCAAHGCAGATIGAVAARAKIGKSTVYHYFPTREALLEALVARSFCLDEVDLLGEEGIGESPLHGLDQLLLRIAVQLDQWAALGPTVVELLATPWGREAYGRSMAAIRKRLRVLIVEGQRLGVWAGGDPDIRVAVALSCLHGVLFQSLVEPLTGSSRNTVEVVRTMVLESLSRGTSASPVSGAFNRRATDRPIRPAWR